MGAGFGRGLFPGLGEGSFEDSPRLGERFGGFDGLAKVTDEELAPGAGDSLGVSVKESEGLDEESAIKRPSLASKDGDWKSLGKMGRKGGAAGATRYVDISAECGFCFAILITNAKKGNVQVAG